MTFQVLADFDRDNSFAYDLTDYTQDVRFFNGMRDIYQSVGDDTTIELTLVNSDGRFNPENSSGAYYGTIGLNCRVQVVDDVAGTLAMGYITSIDPEHIASGPATGNTFALISCEGARDIFSRMTLDLSIYQSVKGGTIIQDIMTGADYPYSAETGKTTFAHFGDEDVSSNAWSAITTITEGERGRFFQARNGEMTWWDRHHILLVTTTSGTVTMGGTIRPIDVDYEYRLSNVYNVVRVEVEPRNTMSSSGTLWYTDNDINVPVGGTVVFEGLMRDGDGRFVGADSVTLSPTFSAGTATLSYQIYGARLEITAVNSGTSTAVMDSVSAVGTGYQNRNPLIYKAEDSASIALYGRRQIEFNFPPLATFDDASSIANYELNRRKTPQGVIRSMLFTATGNGTSNAHLLNWCIGTKLRTVLNNGHDSTHIVIGEEHQLSFGGKYPIHECRFYMEPADINRYWILGLAGYGELSETTVLAY